MLINIILDGKLMAAPLKTSGYTTKNEALKLLAQEKKQSRLKSLRGKLQWDEDLNELRSSR